MLAPLVAGEPLVGEQAAGLVERDAGRRASRRPAILRKAALVLRPQAVNDEAEALTYQWEFWARLNQLTPPEPWTYWLLLAGRGFGKTRTGAETVRMFVERGWAKRIAIAACARWP